MTAIMIIVPITMALYLMASFIVIWQLLEHLVRNKRWVLLFGFIAVCLHGLLLHDWIDIAAGQNLNFFNMFSLMAWLVSILILAMIIVRSVEVLALFIFPIAAFSILFVFIFPSRYVVDTTSPDTLFHIILSIFTFCVLCVAGLLAILLAIQERLLRYKKVGQLFSWLPPLETMETLLFQVIGLGFILLSVVLATSLYFYHTIMLMHVVILQKTIIVLAAWLIFAILLIGRIKWGWRGRKAIYYTLCGVSLLIVAYFGSKLVLEALN